MVKNSYTHPVLAGYKIGPIKAAISKHVYTEGMHSDKESSVQLIVSKDNEMKGFYHPVVTEHGVFIDARSYTKPDKETDSFKINNETEYNFSVSRAQLEQAWTNEQGRHSLAGINSIPANFYSKWVSEGITRVFNLDAENQMILSIVAAWYFFCQFYETDEWDAKELAPKVVSFISRATNVPVDRVLPIIEEYENVQLTNLGAFVAMALEASKGDALHGLSTRGVYSMLTNNWRGAHGNEVAMLALDYPPALYAMIRAAYNDRTYRKTALQQIIDRTKKVIDTKSWVMSLKVVLVSENIIHR